MIFALIGHRVTRRRALFLYGLLNLAVATLIIAVARNIGVLVAGRILQGVSAATVWINGLAIITNTLGQERYGEAIGYTQSSVSLGTTAAPLLGGIAFARGGWPAVSAMTIGTAFLSIVMALIMLEPETKARAKEQGLSAQKYEPADNGAQTVRSEVGGRPSWNKQSHTVVGTPIEPSDERTPLVKSNGIKSSVVKRPPYLILLRSGRVLAAMGGLFTFAVVLFSFEGLVPLYVKETFHWNPTKTALIFLAWIIPGFLSPVAGNLSDRFGSRWFAVGGLLFAVPPLIFMRFAYENEIAHKVLLCGLLALVGKCFLLYPFLPLFQTAWYCSS